MLPTMLNSTSRAVAAVQNQTHTFRNVLQLQSSSPTAGPKNGPGSGGSSRYGNPGSRWHSGYHGAARAVTQANLSTLQDTSDYFQTDDSDEFPSRHVAVHFTTTPSRKTRLRSSSISLTGRPEHLGVLRAVQTFARSKHAFASKIERPSNSRRNSMAATTNAPADDPVRPPTPIIETASAPAVDTLTPEIARILEARDSGDADYVAEVVHSFLKTTDTPSVAEFEAVIDALAFTRVRDEPLTVLLDTYKEFIQRGLLPSVKVHLDLLNALIARDWEVVLAIRELERNARSIGTYGQAPPSLELGLIEKYKSEGNASSAIQIFQTLVSTGRGSEVPAFIYSSMLRLCAIHNNTQAAVSVWSSMENHCAPTAPMYQHMIQLFGAAKDLDNAEKIFTAFRDSVKERTMQWGSSDPNANVTGTLSVWNLMVEAYMTSAAPEKAIALVEEMIQASASATAPIPSGESLGQDHAPLAPFDASGAPCPAPSTFTAVIQGFCAVGDVDTALEWFERLLAQQYRAGPPMIPTIAPTRPDEVAWRVMLDALAKENRADDIVRLLEVHHQRRLVKTDGVPLVFSRMLPVVSTVMSAIENHIDAQDGDKALAKSYLNVMAAQINMPYNRSNAANMVRVIAGHYLELDDPIAAIRVLTLFVQFIDQVFERHTRPSLSALQPELDVIVKMLSPDMAFADLMDLAAVAKAAEMEPQPALSAPLIASFLREPYALSHEQICLVLSHAVTQEVVYRSGLLPEVLKTICNNIPSFSFVISDSYVKAVVDVLVEQQGLAQVQELANELSPNFRIYLARWIAAYGPKPASSPAASETGSLFSYAFDTSSSGLTSPVSQTHTLPPRYRIDEKLSSQIMTSLKKSRVFWISATTPADIDGAVQAFMRGLATGVMPTMESIAALITCLGRARDPTRAKHVYMMSHNCLASLEDDKTAQTEAWFMLEDSMVIALAQAGDLDNAHMHRMRMLDQGRAPSADAYGGLILHVKDTTDDTSNALSLYRESQERGVTPNIYLYNNIISKLAKARKADLALELFHEMKERKISPSSITYGALIGACARVGDVESAETLFGEMTQMRSFKPRVPPYNTMMQMYTTTKPNRERSLHYFSLMKEAGVKPSTYTYKLLMDTYTIDPIDLKQVESIFQHVVNSAEVELTTGHFATLINAHGCVLRDLATAQSVFDSIPSYGLQIDALALEAMVSVFGVHRRTDLIPEYVAKMTAAGVHMTAYVVNNIIKAYAAVGDLPAARAIFESTADPAHGVAALYNHAPHDGEKEAKVNVGVEEPVYREPSTWEAMVRAELGAGERERAIAVLERLKQRQYPDAVFNRISGILVEH